MKRSLLLFLFMLLSFLSCSCAAEEESSSWMDSAVDMPDAARETDTSDSLPSSLFDQAISAQNGGQERAYRVLDDAEAKQYYDDYIAPVGPAVFLLPFEREHMPDEDSFAFYLAFETLASKKDMPGSSFIQAHAKEEGTQYYIEQELVEEYLCNIFDLQVEDIRKVTRNYDAERQAYRVLDGVGGYMPAVCVEAVLPGEDDEPAQLLLSFFAGPADPIARQGVLTVRTDDSGGIHYVSYSIK
jgi:hypothetical protein